MSILLTSTLFQTTNQLIMKKSYLIILLTGLGLNACKKQDSPPAPVADFYLDTQHSSTITVRENTDIIPINNSTNAVSYLWDFGNGKTSTEKTPSLNFPIGGDYTVSLTATNKDGSSIVTRKQVKVLPLLIYAIKIDNLNKWSGFNFSSLQKFTGGDVWVEIHKRELNKSYNQLPDASYDYPLYYKSPVYKAASVNEGNTIEIPITEKVALPGKYSNAGYAYVFNLYVKDAKGTHLLFTSEYIATQSTPPAPNFIDWYSTVGNTTVTIKGHY